MAYKKKLTALSLFSGGGGMDIGVLQAGFDVKASIEIDPFCCETLRYAVEKEKRKTKVIEQDIRTINPLELKEQLKLEGLDLLFGGPPCQAFSQIGKRQCLDDERGMLLFEMVRFAKALNPKAILIEQVKGLLNAPTEDGEVGGVFKRLLSQLEELDYVPKWKIIVAADYGVPQMRQRVFIVATKKPNGFEFPAPTHSDQQNITGLFPLPKYRTVGEVINDLPTPPRLNGVIPEDSHADVTPANDSFRINGVPEGSHLAKELHLPIEQRKTLGKKDTTKFRRLSRNEPSLTLRCGEIFYHPIENRYLTPREYMRIHGYPDNYVLKGPIRSRSGQVKYLDQHRQVANSVPPPLAFYLAQSIRKIIECQNSLKFSATP